MSIKKNPIISKNQCGEGEGAWVGGQTYKFLRKKT